MSRRVLLIRHAQVARRWRGYCYGQGDVGLSREGRSQSRAIAAAVSPQLRRHDAVAVIHSGLHRAAYPAGLIAAAVQAIPRIDQRWSERYFGSWELRSWQWIWRRSGNAMDGMLTEPLSFRPGGGETTAQLFARSIQAWLALPQDGLVIVLAHAGPIACVRAYLAGAALAQLGSFIVAPGAVVELP